MTSRRCQPISTCSLLQKLQGTVANDLWCYNKVTADLRQIVLSEMKRLMVQLSTWWQLVVWGQWLIYGLKPIRIVNNSTLQSTVTPSTGWWALRRRQFTRWRRKVPGSQNVRGAGITDSYPGWRVTRDIVDSKIAPAQNVTWLPSASVSWRPRSPLSGSRLPRMLLPSGCAHASRGAYPYCSPGRSGAREPFRPRTKMLMVRRTAGRGRRTLPSPATGQSKIKGKVLSTVRICEEFCTESDQFLCMRAPLYHSHIYVCMGFKVLHRLDDFKLYTKKMSQNNDAMNVRAIRVRMIHARFAVRVVRKRTLVASVHLLPMKLSHWSPEDTMSVCFHCFPTWKRWWNDSKNCLLSYPSQVCTFRASS